MFSERLIRSSKPLVARSVQLRQAPAPTTPLIHETFIPAV